MQRNEAERNANANGALFRKRIKALALGRYEIDESKKIHWARYGCSRYSPPHRVPFAFYTYVGQQVR